jgi:hypothetical protein
LGLKAQTHFWGYSLKLPTRDSENVSVKVDDAVDKSEDSQDVGPLQASRAWVTQAENNVIDRLVEAGLVAPLESGRLRKQDLDQIVINLVVPNNLAFTDQIHTRILLTTTIEATTVGNTILISKGAHRQPAQRGSDRLGCRHGTGAHRHGPPHRHPLRVQRPPALPRRVDLPAHRHVPLRPRQREAAKRAMEYLQNSMYKDKLPNAGLYYAQLGGSREGAEGAQHAQAGRFAAQGRRNPVDGDLQKMSPKLNWDDLTQMSGAAAGSWLKTDPWDDKVHSSTPKIYAP